MFEKPSFKSHRIETCNNLRSELGHDHNHNAGQEAGLQQQGLRNLIWDNNKTTTTTTMATSMMKPTTTTIWGPQASLQKQFVRKLNMDKYFMHLPKARTMTTTSFEEFWAGFSPGQLQELGRGSHRAISRGSWSTWRRRRPGIQRRPWTNAFAFTVLKLKDKEDLPPHEKAFNVVSPCSSLSEPVRLGVGQPVMWVGLDRDFIQDKVVFSFGELD